MAINKVIYDSKVLIDVTDCDITEADVAAGKRFIKKNGEKSVGTSTGGGGTSAVLGKLNASSNGTYEAGSALTLVPSGIYQFKEQLPVETLAELYSATQGNNGVIFSAVIQEVVAAKLAIYKTNDVYILESNSGGGIVENIYSTGTATFKYHSSMNNTDVEVELTPGWNFFAAFGDIHMPGTSLIKLPRDISGIPEGVVNLVDLQFDTNNCVEAVADESSVTITIEGLGQFVKLNNSFDPTKRFAIASLGGADEFNPVSDPSGGDMTAMVPVFRNLTLPNLQNDIEGIKYLTSMFFPVFLVYVEDSSKIQVTSGTAESGCWYLIQDATTTPWTFAYDKDLVDGYNKVTVNVKPVLQNKTVIESGTYTCDEGYDGLGQVDVITVDRRTLLDGGKIAVHSIIGADDLSLDPNIGTIEELIINKGATEVSKGRNRTNLRRVILPDTLERIDSFEGCRNLESIAIPDKVTQIGYKAFYECSGLTNITIGNGVKNIENYAFAHCSGLTSMTIPDGVTKIGAGAFSECSGLTSITIPDSVTKILSSPFSGCDLDSISVSQGNTVYHSQGNCLIETASKKLISGTNSSIIPDDGSVTSIEQSAFQNCSRLTSITIPDSVTSIEGWAFCDCSGLTSVTIPDSVTNIERCAFQNCSGLTSITIPNSVTSIGDHAFRNCSGLMSITIGNSVISIGYAAFHSCSRLTSITIPDSVTNIDDYAFRNCSGLMSVTIGNGAKSIGKYAFQDCSRLESVTILAVTPPTLLNSDTFHNTVLTQIIVPVGCGEAYKTAANWSAYADYIIEEGMHRVTLGESVTCSVGGTSYSNQTFDVADQTVIHFEVGQPAEGGVVSSTPDGIFLNGVLVSDNSGPATYDLTVTGNVSVTYSAGDVIGDITYNHCYKIVMN